MVPTFWEVRRMSPKRVPLGLREGEVVGPSGMILSSLLPGLELRRSRLLLLLDEGEDAVVIADGVYSVGVGLDADAAEEEDGEDGP